MFTSIESGCMAVGYFSGLVWRKWKMLWLHYHYGNASCGDFSFLGRCSGLVQAGVRAPAFHAATSSNSGEWDEDERPHGHTSTPSFVTLPLIHCMEPRTPPRMWNHHNITLLNVNLKFCLLFKKKQIYHLKKCWVGKIIQKYVCKLG